MYRLYLPCAGIFARQPSNPGMTEGILIPQLSSLSCQKAPEWCDHGLEERLGDAPLAINPQSAKQLCSINLSVIKDLHFPIDNG